MDLETSDAAKHGVECFYGGQKMRSLLERRLAILLDGLEIKWRYEDEYFELKDGQIKYLPDFYLPEHDQYIEAKGVFSDSDRKKIAQFSKERDEELIFIKSDTAHFVMMHPHSDEPSFGPAHICKCSNCGEYCIVPEYGSYACRVCGNHSGDSDIVKYNFMEGSNHYTSYQTDLQILNHQKVNEWLKEVKN